MILKIVPNGNLLLMAVYLLTGPLAIVASMWVHKRTLGKKKVSP